MADVFVELKAIITEFQAKMAEARGEMKKTEEEGSGHFNTLSKVGGFALAGIAGAAVGVATAAVKMGNELEDSQAKLEQAIKNTGGTYDQYTGKIATADKSMEKFGFTNAQTQDALAAGTTATGSANKALSLLGLAADLAAMKHTDLSTAMVAVARASEGQTRPLQQLGIMIPALTVSGSSLKTAQDNLAKSEAAVNAILKQFPDAANAASKGHKQYEAALAKVAAAQAKLNEMGQSGTTIVDALQKKLGGQAAAAANTFSGKINAAKAQVEDMAAKLGLKLIPIIERVIGVTSDVIGWFERHKAAAIALAGVITGVLAVAISAFAVNKIGKLIQSVQGAIGIFKKMGSQAATTAADTEASSAGMATKFSGALGVMGAGILAFQGTMGLLKSNFLGLGGFVNGAAKAISDFFGGVGQVKPTTSLTSQTIAFLEAVAAGRTYAANITPAEAVADLHQQHVPGYAIGGYVQQGGLALLHAGETVIPASPATGFGGGNLVLQVDGQRLGQIAGPVVRSWLLQTAGHGNSRKIGLA